MDAVSEGRGFWISDYGNRTREMMDADRRNKIRDADHRNKTREMMDADIVTRLETLTTGTRLGR